ncbi:MAG: hypothetical protein NT154_04715, partial [Verrucomicrobia bacterium]|nr:hypothetical protein [Verrucomicrobiota bacterium]
MTTIPHKSPPSTRTGVSDQNPDAQGHRKRLQAERTANGSRTPARLGLNRQPKKFRVTLARPVLQVVAETSVAALSLLLCGFAFATEANAPSQERLPDFDTRAAVAPRLKAAAEPIETLRARVPKVTLDWAPVVGSPKWIGSGDGFLTGPNGEGGAVTHTFLAKHRDDDPLRAVKAFVDEHQALFGHNSSALAAARTVHDYVSRHNGLRSTMWQQQHAGIDVFEAVFLAHTTKLGELVNVSSQFLPGLDEAAEKLGEAAEGPGLTAQRAIVLAARHLGADQAVEAGLSVSNAPAGPEQRQKFGAAFLRGQAHTRLVWLPMDGATLRLCWDVALSARVRPEVYRLLVDATSGAVLVRRCQTIDHGPATYRVYTTESPTPISPGHAAPGDLSQPPTVSR